MSEDELNNSIPWHVSAYVAVFSYPLVASMLLAVLIAPLGVVAAPYLLSLFPVPTGLTLPATWRALSTWLTATVLLYAHFTKPL